MAKANYGVDAPTVLRNLVIGALLCFLIGVLTFPPFLGPAAGFTFAALMMLWSSLYGKFRARQTPRRDPVARR